MSVPNFINILGANAFVDASGRPLARGILIVTAVDGTGNEIPFQIGGGGIALVDKIERAIAAGSMVGTLQLANPATSDVEIGYTFTIHNGIDPHVTCIPKVLIAADGSGNFNLATMSAGNYTLAETVPKLWPTFTAAATALGTGVSPTAVITGTPANPILTLGIPGGSGGGGSTSPATSTTQGTVQLAVGQTSTTLSTVATTGSYADLSNKPTIPAGTVTSVSGATSGGFAVSATAGATPIVSVAADGTHYLPTTTDEAAWNAKQAALGFVPLNPANNLSELTSTAATARTNLGLGTAATSAASAFDAAGTAATALATAEAFSANASNLSSGTVPAGLLPFPAVASLGGVKSLAAVAHKFLTSIGTDGVPVAAQPAYSDISGTPRWQQLLPLEPTQTCLVSPHWLLLLLRTRLLTRE
jgi:hypothetical protein